ncbi:MAG: alanine racemase [Desulfobacteraceae bacterium]|nr:alanine racemase [Desulfobacteraceae bacterium]
MMPFETYAEVNLDNLVENVDRIRRKVAPARVIAVIKADAYGHGAVPVARRLVREGQELFAVAQFGEAMELRESGITQPILVLGRLFPHQIPEAVKASLRLTLFGEEDLRWVEKCVADTPAKVHVKLETGMGRKGVLASDAPALFDKIGRSRSCDWEGLFTHFSTADETDKTFARRQLSRFREILSILSGFEKKPRMIHMASSGAILDLPESYFDAVRPGILMYGHYPSRDTSQSIEPRQVMSLKTFVAHVREMPEAHPISYGRRWSTPGPTRIAVLPIGYADGMSRRFTNNGEVLIRGKRYPMVGTVTMDYIMVNIGDARVAVGDEVLVWGESSEGSIRTLDVAQRLGTIPYELTCAVSKRVKRVYIGAA